MQITKCRRFLSALIAISLFNTGLVSSGQAALIGTGDAIAVEERAERIEVITGFLNRADVRDQLVRFGVDPVVAADRVASLTDAELRQLDQRVADLEAGGLDAIGVLGIVFLVLLVLELVGVTDIFKAL